MDTIFRRPSSFTQRLLHNATLAYKNQNDRKLKKSTKTVFVTIYLMIFCGRIIGALSSDWLLPLPPIRQQHNHDQLSQHNFKTQELSTKYSPKTQTQQHNNQYQLSQHNFKTQELSTKYSPKTQTQQHNQCHLSQHSFTRRTKYSKHVMC